MKANNKIMINSNCRTCGEPLTQPASRMSYCDLDCYHNYGRYEATATTGERVIGEYIENNIVNLTFCEYNGCSCQSRILDSRGLEHDIIRDTLKIKHKGEYKITNWECDLCGMPFHSEELKKELENGELDPPYFCGKCEKDMHINTEEI